MSNFRSSEVTERVEITELENGDYVWCQGYLFEIHDISFELWGDRCTVVRYTGNVVKGVTGNEHVYDGGRYGHNDTITACRVKRCFIN